MKIVKYSEFQGQELNENFWQDVKYGFSKLGRYKADGKILGKKSTDDKSREEIKEIMKKETNKLLKQVYGEVKIQAPEFPNDRRKVTFLKGVIIFGQFYDSIVNATKKEPGSEGYMSQEVANEIIKDLRKVVKKFLDVDLKAVYSVTESKYDKISEDEIQDLNESVESIYEEEEIIKKLGQLKDRAMDRLFGAKKGTDAPQKTTKGQSAKLQQTSGQKNVDSERMKTLESNKLPIILAGAGAALGALGWIAQTDWFKDLISTTIKNPAQFGEETFTKTVEQNLKVDPNGWSYTIQNNGFQDATGKSLAFDQPVGNLKDAFKFYGGGDESKGLEAMSNFLSPDSREASIDNIRQQLQDPSNKTIGDIFNKEEGTWGDKGLMGQRGGVKSFIAKQVYTQTKKVLIKAGFTTTTTSALGAKLVALAPILGGIGIALVGAGALVKLLREKGQRQSRAKTLNDLLQSLKLVGVDEEGGSKQEDINKSEDDKSKNIEKDLKGDTKLSEKSVYPVMIKNLQSLRSLIINLDNVSLEDERRKVQKDFTSETGEKTNTSGKSVEKRYQELLNIWKENQRSSGKSNLNPGEGTRKRLMRQAESEVKESIHIKRFDSLIMEKDRIGKTSNIEITKSEDYLTQSVLKIRKSVKSLKDEKDKGVGITEEFLTNILDKKMEVETKEPVKQLYSEIYSYLYGPNSSTLGEFEKLYKESVQIISNKSKRQVVAEKIARFSKRSLQFEGEGFYSGLGKFGDYLEEFNNTLKQIMDYYKSKSTNESMVIRFEDFN